LHTSGLTLQRVEHNSDDCRDEHCPVAEDDSGPGVLQFDATARCMGKHNGRPRDRQDRDNVPNDVRGWHIIHLVIDTSGFRPNFYCVALCHSLSLHPTRVPLSNLSLSFRNLTRIQRPSLEELDDERAISKGAFALLFFFIPLNKHVDVGL